MAPLPAPASVQPVPRDRGHSWMSLAEWYERHAADVAIAAAGEVDLLFVGDSITQGWGDGGVWREAVEPWRAANFGIGGDRTENVLWRLDHGAVGVLKPRVVVLLIGTNNIAGAPAGVDGVDYVNAGIVAVVQRLRESFPEARLLVLGIFPRDERPDAPVRGVIRGINARLAALDDGRTTFVRDIGSVFLEPNGSISRAIMPDALHLSEAGYRKWATALRPIIEPWLEPMPIHQDPGTVHAP